MSWHLWIESPTETVPDEYAEPVDGHTYNLSPMWRLASVFSEGSRDLDGMPVRVVAARARAGLMQALTYPKAFQALNPENGWGDYDGFVQVLTKLAIACEMAPRDAKVKWSG